MRGSRKVESNRAYARKLPWAGGMILALIPGFISGITPSSLPPCSPPVNCQPSAKLTFPLRLSIEQGYQMLTLGQANKAIQIAEALMAASPNNWAGYELMGDAQASLGRYELAQDAFLKAGRLAPYLPQLQKKALLAQSQMREPQSAQAEAMLTEILAKIQREELQGLREQVLAVVAKNESLVPHRNQIQSIHQETVKVGERWLTEGRGEEAWQLASATLWLDPSHPEVNRLIGRAAAQAGSEEEAVFAFQRALTNKPEDSSLIQELRATRKRLGFSDLGVGMEELEPYQASEEGSQGHQVYGYAMLGYGWDSNLYLNDDTSETGDANTDILVSVEHQYVGCQKEWRWMNRFRFFLTDLAHQETEDLLLARPSTGIGYQSGSDFVGTMIFWEPLFLEGAYYQNQKGFEVFASHFGTTSSQYYALYRYTHRHVFPTRGNSLDKNRGYAHYLYTSWTYYCENESWWNTNLSYYYSVSPINQAPDSVYHRPQGQVYYHFMAHEDLEIYLGGSVWLDRYSNHHLTYTDRRERTLGGSLDLGAYWSLCENLSLLFSVYQAKGDSNIPTANYQQGKYGISLQYLF